MRKIDYNGSRAFAAMYDETVSISGKRAAGPFATSCAACVVDCGYDIAIDETASIDSRARKLSVVIGRSGPKSWPYQFAPRAGDVVMLEDGTKCAVKAAKIMAGGDYSLEVRQI